MKESYIKEENNFTNYIKKKTYIEHTDNNKSGSINYLILPEEYDVFSGLNLSILGEAELYQKKLIEEFLLELKEKLKYIFYLKGIIRILPKLSFSKDSDDAFIINWAYSNYRIFVNFEKNVDDSFFGIIAKDDNTNVFSNSGKLNENNYHTVINKFLDYIFNQT